MTPSNPRLEHPRMVSRRVVRAVRCPSTWFFATFVLLCGCESTPPPPTPQAALRAAMASQFETGPGPFSFDWQIPPGNLTERNLHIPGEDFTVSGYIQFVTADPSDKWAAVASVFVAGAKDKDAVGLQAFVLPADRTNIELAIHDGRQGNQHRSIFASVPLTDKFVPFEITVKSGQLTLSVGHAARTVSVASIKLTCVRLGASSGHVRFANIAVTAD
jgi:hypothetical protein